MCRFLRGRTRCWRWRCRSGVRFLRGVRLWARSQVTQRRLRCRFVRCGRKAQCSAWSLCARSPCRSSLQSWPRRASRGAERTITIQRNDLQQICGKNRYWGGGRGPLLGYGAGACAQDTHQTIMRQMGEILRNGFWCRRDGGPKQGKPGEFADEADGFEGDGEDLADEAEGPWRGERDDANWMWARTQNEGWDCSQPSFVFARFCRNLAPTTKTCRRDPVGGLVLVYSG
jgi:hypothetical protein